VWDGLQIIKAVIDAGMRLRMQRFRRSASRRPADVRCGPVGARRLCVEITAAAARVISQIAFVIARSYNVSQSTIARLPVPESHA